MVPSGICPACGIVYDKWSPQEVQDSEASTASSMQMDEPEQLEFRSIITSLKEIVLSVPDHVDPVVFWSRVLAYGVFFIWGWWFISTDGNWLKVGASFLHNVNLPFHEFGHVAFRPFGNFMSILGGSLFQLIVPIVFLVYFIRRCENFEASVMLWWLGQNFIDLSPYIADAEYRAIPLIMGLGEEAHDWGNLLTMLDMLDKAYYVSRTSYLLGCAFILISLAWGAYILLQQKKNTTKF